MLSAKQRRIASFGARRKRWTLVSGPVGSGKTHAGIIGTLLWASRWGGAEFGVLTKGHPQLAAVLKGGIERAIDDAVKVDSDGGFYLPGHNGQPNRFWCFVAQDKRAEPRLRSFNLSGFLIDEMTTLPPLILDAANSRCRVGDAKLLGMTNPDGPRHPVRLKYFLRPDQMNAEVIETELRDNPTIRDDYIDSLKATYTGHMLERMVYGRWAAASGLVFPHAIDASGGVPPLGGLVAYDVVVDVGESSITHALLSGRTLDGQTWIIDECVHNHLLEGVLTDREMVAKVRRHFGGFEIHSWIVDPAAKRFRQELLAQMPNAIVGKAENDWEEGVEEVNHWIGVGALKLWGERLPHLMSEIGALVWDEDMAEAGKDVPIKTPDHGTDAMRYLVFTRAVHEAGGRKAWEIQRQRRKEMRT